MVSEELIKQLKSSFRGKVILPGDDLYNETRKVYNGMIDRYPALIANCVDTVDVITIVNFGRNNKIPMSILGGGHNAGGLGVTNDGIVINLSAIRYTYVDTAAETVRVGGGNTWGDVDHATYPFAYAVPAGFISTTGVGGLTLGGGIGHLSRKYGLTIDSLLEADVVLANGKVVKASEKENPDLFWALRGGGGNFGVVTSFLFKMRKITNSFAGLTFWDLDKAEEILKWYNNFIDVAPQELNGFFAFLTVPPGDPFPKELHLKKMCGVMWYYTGTEEESKELFTAIRNQKPKFEFLGNMPHPAINSMFDPLYPKGLQWYWKADFINDLTDDAIKEHVKFGKQLPTMLSTIHIYPVSGAVHKVKSDETAFNYRKAKYSAVIVGVDPDPANKDLITKWTKDYYNAAVRPFSAGGAYVNFMMDDEGQDRVIASYGSNYERLVEVKQKYDPDNIFHVNQNIVPRKKEETGALELEATE